MATLFGKEVGETKTFENLSYRIVGDGAVEITGFASLQAQRETKGLVIPTQIEGHPVRYIAPHAFEESGVRHVKVPRFGVQIGSEAFANCKELEFFGYSSGLSQNDDYMAIENGAFKGCEELKSVNFENIGWIGDEAFCGCKSLKYAAMPITYHIGEHAFSDSGITDAEVSRSCFVKEDAFADCKDLKSFEIKFDDLVDIKRSPEKILDVAAKTGVPSDIVKFSETKEAISDMQRKLKDASLPEKLEAYNNALKYVSPVGKEKIRELAQQEYRRAYNEIVYGNNDDKSPSDSSMSVQEKLGVIKFGEETTERALNHLNGYFTIYPELNVKTQPALSSGRPDVSKDTVTRDDTI